MQQLLDMIFPQPFVDGTDVVRTSTVSYAITEAGEVMFSDDAYESDVECIWVHVPVYVTIEALEWVVDAAHMQALS